MHSISLHVTTNADRGSEWGSLYFSNWNGTYYEEALAYVNRDAKGFVDFEKISSMEGVALANQVANPDSAKMGASKQVKTVITFDNGRSWKSLTAPEKDSEGHPYPCQVRLHIDGKICF